MRKNPLFCCVREKVTIYIRRSKQAERTLEIFTVVQESFVFFKKGASQLTNTTYLGRLSNLLPVDSFALRCLCLSRLLSAPDYVEPFLISYSGAPASASCPGCGEGSSARRKLFCDRNASTGWMACPGLAHTSKTLSLQFFHVFHWVSNVPISI